MIEFITLFLGGLVVGIQPVEVMVEPSVAAVELYLNGETVARLEQPSWRAEVNFGGELAPQLLEAVALGASGREIDRTRQWINMSPHEAGTAVMLEPGRNGVGAIARVSWASVSEQEEPTRTAVYLDGELLEERNPRAIFLPAFDPEEPHHLRVELEFAGSLSSVAEVTFGGVFGEEVSTELTASVIELDKGKTISAARDVEGWFFVGDEPLAVRAIETGMAEILVIRDETARPFMKFQYGERRLAAPVSSTRVRKDHQLRLVATCPVSVPRGGSQIDLFPISQEITREHGNLQRILSRLDTQDCSPEEQELADAVAVAGLAASNSGRRRAVVLITYRYPPDNSSYRPAQVRRYLEKLRVPFEVWSLDKKVDVMAGWGSAVDVSNPDRLAKAYYRLGKRLDRQRVVWLDGLHLPQSIRLHPNVKGVRLVE